jgi:NhaP-type Na+/H+ or K+/H+ antiporter
MAAQWHPGAVSRERQSRLSPMTLTLLWLTLGGAVLGALFGGLMVALATMADNQRPGSEPLDSAAALEFVVVCAAVVGAAAGGCFALAAAYVKVSDRRRSRRKSADGG